MLAKRPGECVNNAVYETCDSKSEGEKITSCVAEQRSGQVTVKRVIVGSYTYTHTGITDNSMLLLEPNSIRPPSATPIVACAVAHASLFSAAHVAEQEHTRVRESETEVQRMAVLGETRSWSPKPWEFRRYNCDFHQKSEVNKLSLLIDIFSLKCKLLETLLCFLVG